MIKNIWLQRYYNFAKYTKSRGLYNTLASIYIKASNIKLAFS